MIDNLIDIKASMNELFGRLKDYLETNKVMLEKIKIVIGNDLGSCERKDCTVEKPCAICHSLRQLDKDIDEVLG